MAVPNSARIFSCWVEESGDSRLQINGYRWNPVKWFISWVGILLSVGLLRLFFYWKPDWHVFAMCDACPLLDAELILVSDEHHRLVVRPVRLATTSEGGFSLPSKGGRFQPVSSYKFFTFRKLRYILHPETQMFSRTVSLDSQIPEALFHEWAAGLSTTDVLCRMGVYGKNVIQVTVKPIWKLLFLEVITPFYIFQIFSVILWYNDEYIWYASVIVLISTLSISADVYQIHKTEKTLRDMVHSTDIVHCLRDGAEVELMSDGLVPGDVLLIPKHGCIMQCDAVLLTGTCIANESMLTGESVPVTKTNLPVADDHRITYYNNKDHAKHTLYCGTRILQTRYYSGRSVKALVIRSGYATLKGQLVRSIMYPKPVDFQFTKDLIKFVGFLASIAVIGFAYTIIIMTARDYAAKKIILRSLDIMTIVVPPALPAAMTIGILAAQMRLKRKKIFCISPSTINTCGGINIVCFDKTGTLTEDGLDFYCAVGTHKPTLEPDVKRFLAEKSTLKELKEDDDLLRAMATCHSLTRIEGEISGDPIDLILFRETGWILEEPEVTEEAGQYDILAPTVVRPVPKESELELGILRQFPFSSDLQRMSVLVRILGEADLVLFCKGAPEMVASLSIPSTVPSNFTEVLQGYARHGYRVLGVARRRLKLSFVKAQRVPRHQIETELDFLGLVVLENRLKPQTEPVIGQLKAANIRCVMVTGDNLLTAVSVGHECGILFPDRDLYFLEATTTSSGETRLQLRSEESFLGPVLNSSSSSVDLSRQQLQSSTISLDLESCWAKLSVKYQLAMTGNTFSTVVHEYPELLSRLMCVCNVFARMSPDQKAQLVDELQKVEYVVAMCGDGANDCGALKAAHAGISLSEAEASIASPFTSATPDIRCVPTVIQEGRAALVTSFGVFKYMAGYSLTQFISVCLLYWIATNLSDFQFLYIDLFLITFFAIFFGYTDAAESLVPQPPPSRILAIPSVVSVVVMIAINCSFQVFVFLFVKRQPWFRPFTDPGDHDNYYSYQGTVVFWISVFQYITLAVVYSKSYPYRKPLYNNRLFSATLVIMTGVSVWWTLAPPEWVTQWLNLMMPPFLQFRALLLLLAAVCFVLCFLVEMWLVDWLLVERAERKSWLRSDWRHKPKFVHILGEIGRNPSWLRKFLGDARPPRSPFPGSLSGASSGNEDDALFIPQVKDHHSTSF